MAADLEAGNAYLQLMASGRGLQRDTEKQVKKVKAPDIVAKIDAKIGDLEKQAAKARAILAKVKTAGSDPQIGLDIAELQAKAAVVRQRLDELRGKTATPKVRADIASAEAQLGRIETKMRALEGKRSTTRVDADTAKAQADVTRFESQISRLRQQRAQVTVDAQGVATTQAELQSVSRTANALDGKHANIFVTESGSATAASKLLMLAAALGAVAAAAPAAVGALAAVAGAGGAAAQGALAAAAGFSGIGDALTAVESQEKSAATASTQAASQRQSAARQIASAQRALGQAQQQQARTAIQGAQQVASAERSLAAARVAAARTAIQGAQQVAAAQRALATAQIQAARAVEDAQRAYTRAVQAEKYAQEDVTRARQEARRALADLQLQASGAALSEERAVLNLERAQERYNAAVAAGIPEGREKQELSLDAREAQQSLAETRNRLKNLTEDQAEWARTGVEGSQQVVAAQRALQAAQDAVGDSARQVSRAQVDGARAVEDAQIALSQAIQQAGWANEDAARGVQDAEIALAEARQQAAWANEDAAAAVADAQRALADAYADAGQAGAAGADQAAYALSQLSPAGREFVRFMVQEWKPAVERVTHATAEELLPRVQAAMKNLLTLEPMVTQGLVGSARVIGDLAVRGSELAASAPFQASFAGIMGSNTRSLQSYGNAGLSMFGIITDLLAVAGPYGEEFARLVDYSAQAAETWIIGARASGELDRILRSGADTLYFLGNVLGQTASGAWGLIQGLSPLGGLLLTIAGNAIEFVGNVASWNPTLTSAAVGTGLAVAALLRLNAAVRGVSFLTTITSAGAMSGSLRTLLVPSALAATMGMQRLGVGAAGMATRVGVSAGAAATFGTRVAGLASALPLLAIAVTAAVVSYDALTTSSSEAADALLEGGSAAASMRTELAANDAKQAEYTARMGEGMGALREWATSMLGTETTTRQANAALEERIAVMSPLQAAQARATLAQTEYETALRETGPTSERTATAQANLANATDRVEAEQRQARLATMSATEALREQQDQSLGSINSRLQLESSTRQVARAQQEYAAELARTGPNSLEAQDALGRLQEAQTRQAAAARKAAEDEATRTGVVDTSAASNLAYAHSIGQMVTATQGQLSPALTQMVNTLNAAGLSAAGARVQFDAAGRAVAIFPDGKTVVLDANTSPVYPALAAVKLAVDSTRGTVGVDADPGPGQLRVGQFKLQTDLTRGVVTIDGNISPADQARLGIQAKTDGTTGTMFINGNSVPCDGQLNGARFRVDATTGVMSIDGNPAQADAQSRGAHDRASQPQVFPLAAQPDYAGISGFFRWVLDGISSIARAYASAFSGGIGGFSAGGPVRGYNTGGTIQAHATAVRGYARGAGGSTHIPASDTVPIMATPGEFMERKSAVDRLGVPFFSMTNEIRRQDAGAVRDAAFSALRGQPWVPAGTSIDGILGSRMGERRGERVGYATGGPVQSVTVAPSGHRYDMAATRPKVSTDTAVSTAGPSENGQQPLIGQYNHYSGGGESFQDGVEAVMYRTRQARRGGPR